MTLGDAVAARVPAAVLETFDRVRAAGGTYADGLARVRAAFTSRGLAPPDRAEIDAMLYEGERAAEGW